MYAEFYSTGYPDPDPDKFLDPQQPARPTGPTCTPCKTSALQQRSIAAHSLDNTGSDHAGISYPGSDNYEPDIHIQVFKRRLFLWC